jgi:DNA invertase Pin-like site-specific DNA recombinase
MYDREVVVRVACYAALSERDRKSPSAQMKSLKAYASIRKWNVVFEAIEIGPSAVKRRARQKFLDSAVPHKIDAIIVWKLDCWSHSVGDLLSSLKELRDIGIDFVSIAEPVDLTGPSGKTFAGIFSLFAEFERDIQSERIKSGIAEARRNGQSHGRPVSVGKKIIQVKRMYKQGYSQSEIARRLEIGRTSVRRMVDM